jgi:hypothetical protein
VGRRLRGKTFFSFSDIEYEEIMYIKPVRKQSYTVLVQPNIDEDGNLQPMVIDSKGRIIVDSYGYIQSLKACPSGVNCIGQKTQTSGIQEAVNYVENNGGGLVFIKSGTYAITGSVASVNIIQGNIKIKGESKYSTVITNTKSGQSIFSVSASNVEISDLTLENAGQYFILTQPTSSGQVLEHLYYHDLNIIGGNSIGTGQFMFIDQYASKTLGAVDFKHVLLENIYINTEGKTGGNEILDFLYIQPFDFMVKNVYINNPSGPAFETSLYGGELMFENLMIEAGVIMLGASFNPVYIEFDRLRPSPYVSPTAGMVQIQLSQSPSTNGYMPMYLRISNSRDIWVLPQVDGIPYPLIEMLEVDNIQISNPNVSNLIYNVAAKVMRVSGVAYPYNFGSAYSGIGQNAPAITIPPLSTSANISIELSDLILGYPNNNEGNALLIGLSGPASSSITQKYSIKISGVFPLSQSAVRISVSGTAYPDFASAVLNNPSLFYAFEIDAIDSASGIYYKSKVVPGMSVSTPSVPPSGTAIQNTNPYPVDVYISGGSATQVQVTRNGTTYTVWSSSTATAIPPLLVHLGAGDSITITYSTAPSWIWLPSS